MARDDIDKRFLEAALKKELVDPTVLAAGTTRAVREKRSLSAAIVLEAPEEKRGELLAVLKHLHGGSAAETGDFERHEDKLLGRFALRGGDLEEEALKKALAQQESRRRKGEKARLGDILVASGALEAARAEKLFRRYEKRVFVCPDCWSPNPRDYQSGTAWSKDCVRCGSTARAPRVGERASWFGGAASERPAEEAAPAAQPKATPSKGKIRTPSEKTEKAEKTAKPAKAEKAPSGKVAVSVAEAGSKDDAEPAAAPPRGSKRLLLVAGGAGALVLALVVLLVAWRASVSAERASRWRALEGRVAAAREHKAKSDMPLAITAYTSALESVEGLAPPDDAARALVQRARAESDLLAELEDATRRDDVGRLGTLAANAKDPDVLLALCERLGRSKEPRAADGLLDLAKASDEKVASRALALGLERKGSLGLPFLELALDGKDAEVAKAAAAIVRTLDETWAAPVMVKALDRFPRDEELAVAIAAAVTRWKEAHAVPALRKLAHSDWPYVSRPALALLVQRHTLDSTPELLLALERAELQADAIAAFKALGPDAIAPLGAALAKGQATAARALVALGTPVALSVIADGLPKLGWTERALAIAALKGKAAPADLKAAIEKVLGAEAAALEAREPTLELADAMTIIDVGWTVAPTAAEVAHAAWAFRHFEKVRARELKATFFAAETVPSLGAGSRVELRNYEASSVDFFVSGKKPVARSIRSGTSYHVDLPPGRYMIGLEITSSSGTLSWSGPVELTAGKSLSLPVGTPPQAGSSGSTPPTTPAAGGDAGVSGARKTKEQLDAQIKRMTEHSLFEQKIRDEAASTIAARVTAGPWSKDKMVTIDTENYRVTSDAPKEQASELSREVESIYAEWVKFFPSPRKAGERQLVRFFAKQADFDQWMAQTDLRAVVGTKLVQRWRLVERAKEQIARAPTDAARSAAALEVVASALPRPSVYLEPGFDLQFLSALDDELADLEETKDPAQLGAGLLRAARAAHYELLARAVGVNGHYALGYFSPATKELNLYVRDTWRDTLRHEAFHQFLLPQMPHAARWMHEGLAAYFQSYPERRGLTSRYVAELKNMEAAKHGGYIDSLSLKGLFTENVLQTGYGPAWSFIYYIMEKEPKLLEKIWRLCKAAENQGQALGSYDFLRLLDDAPATEARWKAFTKSVLEKGE